MCRYHYAEGADKKNGNLHSKCKILLLNSLSVHVYWVYCVLRTVLRYNVSNERNSKESNRVKRCECDLLYDDLSAVISLIIINSFIFNFSVVNVLLILCKPFYCWRNMENLLCTV